MSRQWKPGDVAMVDSWRGKGQIAFRNGYASSWVSAECGGLGVDDRWTVRPLAVIDPEDREQVERLVRFAHPQAAGPKHLADRLQAALRSLVTPPKPEEPGRYGVVVAGDGREWFRWTTSERRGRDWCRPSTGDAEATAFARWDDLEVVRVISEGVTP